MTEDLTDAALSLGAQDHISAVVLSGAGRYFCAGADLDGMKTQIEADRATALNAARKLAIMLKTLNEIPNPLIGPIPGGAFGGAALARRSTTR